MSTNPSSISISEERRKRELEKKFQIKGAHERDITGLTRILYITLHIGSAIGAIAALFNMSFSSKFEQMVYVLIFGIIMALNEIFKGKKMEYFATMKILSNDIDKDMETREKADSEMPKAFMFVLAFWLVSIIGVGFTGFKFGESKTNFKFTAENYDEMLRKTAENAIAAVQSGTKQGYSAKKMQELTANQNAAVEVWNTHKSRVDADNRRNKTDNEDEALVMGLMYVLLAIAYEFVLYHARLWHEKEQYEVLKSKQRAQKQAETEKKQQKTAENSEKQQKTAKSDDVTIKQTDLDAILSELKSTRLQKSLLEETLASKK